MTSESGGPFSDTFLTGMHLALITGDRFCADFAHLKQALSIFAALSKNATVARIDHRMLIKVV